MKILFINNDGGGFADYLELPTGLTLAELFARKLGHQQPDDFLIRVNRQAATRDQVLVDGDRVSITPTKIQGAGG